MSLNIWNGVTQRFHLEEIQFAKICQKEEDWNIFLIYRFHYYIFNKSPKNNYRNLLYSIIINVCRKSNPRYQSE